MTTTTDANPWSVSIEAEHQVPDEDAVFEIEEQLAAAGASGPSLTYAREMDRLGARFFVVGRNELDAFTRAVEVLREVLPDAVVVAFEGMTEDELDRRLAIPVMPELAGAQELAQRLGISRQRFYEVMKMPGFPKPIVELAAGPVWRSDSISHFIQTWARKPGRPRRQADLLVSDSAGVRAVETKVAGKKKTGTKRATRRAVKI